GSDHSAVAAAAHRDCAQNIGRSCLRRPIMRRPGVDRADNPAPALDSFEDNIAQQIEYGAVRVLKTEPMPMPK
ncbi:hypothetical protein, partial [Rhizobium leguminosarum]|uniref:hypothetical protein n=1 Tax=Rhizobium leguminosarum TaxID=384 RepID=UPI001C93C07A